jgi:hypothetical protein
VAIIFELNTDPDSYASLFAPEHPPQVTKSLEQGARLAELWLPGKIEASGGPIDDCLSGPRPYAKFCISTKAVETLKPLIAEICELVPFKFKKWEYWALHISRPTDCLDVERTEFWSDKRHLYSIRKAEFIPGKLPAHDIFRIPGGVSCYVTERFKNTVESASLTGFGFRFAWSSDGSTPPPDRAPSKPSADTPRIKTRRTKRDKILERLWAAIDGVGSSDWLDEILDSATNAPGAQDVISAGPDIIGKALKAGIPKQELSRMCRSIAYFAVFEALVAIEEEGLDKVPALRALHEDLLTADPQK